MAANAPMEESSATPSPLPENTDSAAPPPQPPAHRQDQQDADRYNPVSAPAENQAAPMLHTSIRRAEEEEVAVGDKTEWTKKMRAWLMVLATLVASAAYQAGLNPPGGFWQDNLAADAGKGHTAGYPVMADTNPIRYWIFYSFNVGAFASAVVIILMLMREAFFHRESNLNALRSYVVAAVFNLTVAFGAGSNRSVSDSVSFLCVLGFSFVGVTVEVWYRRRRQAARRSRGDVESHGGGPGT